MVKLVYGWGDNDADYVVYPTINGKQVMCPIYRTWTGVIARCYSKAEQKRKPTYAGCKVCPEWKSFMTFRAWMLTQDWKDKELDKDLIGGGKLYSPETCCFVEHWLNCLFTDAGASRGKFPVGVTLNQGRYMVSVRLHNRQRNIGRFQTPELAHAAYKTAKLNHVQELVSDYPDQRIKQAVLKKAEAQYGCV